MKNIYWFSELGKGNLAEVGGKGANLGEMFNSGFPVPPGFCVSAGAYYDFVKENSIDLVIKAELRGLDYEDTAALQRAGEKIRNAMQNGKISEDLRVDIIRAYNKLCGIDFLPSIDQEILVAVRSSATAEDLPTASFAGQQATFVNIRGGDNVVNAVRDCWASLFEARAIYYRRQNKFDDLRVALSAIVQKMVSSDASGVMFSIDPVTNDEKHLIIEAGFGLGEAVVSGAITPDRYAVDKRKMRIDSVYVSRQERMIVRTKAGETKWVAVPDEMAEKRKIEEEKIMELADYGLRIEEHYGSPQDIEWAIEKNEVFIVQSRPITTMKARQREEKAGERTEERKPAKQQKDAGQTQRWEKVEMKEERMAGGAESAATEGGMVLLNGLPASPGIAFGKVRIIGDIKEIYKLLSGEILVTKMTTPDFVPAMKRAAGIVTDEGGSTCHAAIVSRELGVPCVVGTRRATNVLKDQQEVTIDAMRGIVYEGKVEISVPKKKEDEIAERVIERGALATGTKIYVNLAEPELAERTAAKNVDGVGLLRAEFMIAGFGAHPQKLLKDGKREEFVDKLARGIRKVCAAFHPRPVEYRATDFKTDEYRNLEGGEEFEPKEDNPMIGYRGCFRYLREPEVFRMELEAVKRVREQYGLKNLHLMIPFVRTAQDFSEVKRLVNEAGLRQNHDFKLGIMVEVPSTVILIDEFCDAGIDFISIGSNDLTQLTLGVDRNNSIVAQDFDERNKAVTKSVEHVIGVCREKGVATSICGQAPSVYPEFTEMLVKAGIDAVSVNPDAIESTRRVVASAEKKVLLEAARRK